MKLPVLSRFGRNVLSLVKANVLAQVIVLVSLPLLTRIYSPDEFGVLAVFSGIIALCSAFAALKVDYYLAGGFMEPAQGVQLPLGLGVTTLSAP